MLPSGHQAPGPSFRTWRQEPALPGAASFLRGGHTSENPDATAPARAPEFVIEKRFASIQHAQASPARGSSAVRPDAFVDDEVLPVFEADLDLTLPAGGCCDRSKKPFRHGRRPTTKSTRKSECVLAKCRLFKSAVARAGAGGINDSLRYEPSGGGAAAAVGGQHPYPVFA